MRELKIDERGFPIPFFVPIIHGKPEFRFQDERKLKLCIGKKLCSICGKKLYDKSFWFISGPMGLKNHTASDAPMHEACARFSIAVCPHLVYQRADRRDQLPIEGTVRTNPHMIHEKPNDIFLMKADKVEILEAQNRIFLDFV